MAGPLILRAMGLFNPLMRELAEMLYQYERDYVFNSDTFQSRFDIQPTPYGKGIDEWKGGLRELAMVQPLGNATCRRTPRPKPALRSSPPSPLVHPQVVSIP